MADTPIKQTLCVYLHGRLVGKLHSDNATLSFAYDERYLQKASAVKLSASLPLQQGVFDHQAAVPFFSGLLPDQDVRSRLARHLGLSEKNTFALLKEIGGECAGAVSIYPESVSPRPDDAPTYHVLEDAQAGEILSSLSKRPLLAGEESVRISGAGAQDKLMIAFVGGKVAVPTGSTPSTHIIKPAIKDLENSVHNEFFCMKLAKAVGLPVPEAKVFWLQGEPYYLVERYDRRREKNGLVVRLHQEDFCQAMRISPEIKYENEGGPTLGQCFAFLDERIESGAMPGKNKLILLQGVIFDFLIGNGDVHGKNLSLLYEAESESLAPFYDLLSTVMYSDFHKAKMAMKIGGEYRFKNVTARHWRRLAETLGLRPDFVKQQIATLADTVAKTAPVLQEALGKNAATASLIYRKITEFIARSSRQIVNF